MLQLQKDEVTAMKMEQRERRLFQLDEQANPHQEPWIPVASPDHDPESDDE